LNVPIALETEIAVIGRSCRVPGANSVNELWSLLKAGRCAVTKIPRDRWCHSRFGHPRRSEPGKAYTWAAGVLSDIWSFDPGAFGISPREAEQMDSGNRSSTTQRVTIAARRDGTLTAIVLDAEIAMGVGGWFAGPGRIYTELYACPNVRVTETFVYTHTGAMASFRAPGHVEGAFGLECAMDALARELPLDPLELRRRNYATFDQEKNRAYSSKNLDRCYEEGAERFGWLRRGESAPRTAAEGRRRAERRDRHAHRDGGDGRRRRRGARAVAPLGVIFTSRGAAP